MPDENGARLDGVRVLYVEDDADTRAMVTLLLRVAGATVVAVPSVDDAVAAFEREQPDVLVSDGGLPGGDGWGLVEQIRTWPEARGGRIPAIAVTGATTDADVAHSLHAGFDVHLSKPVEMAELVRTIARLVARGRLPEAPRDHRQNARPNGSHEGTSLVPARDGAH